MTTNVLIASWTTTVALAVLLWRAHCRLVLVARASHELRGPLCAAQLGLSVLALPGPAAIVVADPRRIAQACSNLVGNAAEHGGGEVRVRVSASAATARVEVADDGPGLPASLAVLTATARARSGRRGHGLAI